MKTHFQQVERAAGLGGAQLWALSIVRDRPGIDGAFRLAGWPARYSIPNRNAAGAGRLAGDVLIDWGQLERPLPTKENLAAARIAAMEQLRHADRLRAFVVPAEGSARDAEELARAVRVGLEAPLLLSASVPKLPTAGLLSV